MAILKQKLSRQALDTFVLKYSNDNPNAPKHLSYTTLDGRTVGFNPSDALLRRWYSRISLFFSSNISIPR